VLCNQDIRFVKSGILTGLFARSPLLDLLDCVAHPAEWVLEEPDIMPPLLEEEREESRHSP
jgi:hypothetical protein